MFHICCAQFGFTATETALLLSLLLMLSSLSAQRIFLLPLLLRISISSVVAVREIGNFFGCMCARWSNRKWTKIAFCKLKRGLFPNKLYLCHLNWCVLSSCSVSALEHILISISILCVIDAFGTIWDDKFVLCATSMSIQFGIRVRVDVSFSGFVFAEIGTPPYFHHAIDHIRACTSGGACTMQYCVLACQPHQAELGRFNLHRIMGWS